MNFLGERTEIIKFRKHVRLLDLYSLKPENSNNSFGEIQKYLSIMVSEIRKEILQIIQTWIFFGNLQQILIMVLNYFILP